MIMNNLEFTFIVTLYNTFKTRDYIFFLLEYIHGMTMRNYLDTYKKNKKKHHDSDDEYILSEDEELYSNKDDDDDINIDNIE